MKKYSKKQLYFDWWLLIDILIFIFITFLERFVERLTDWFVNWIMDLEIKRTGKDSIEDLFGNLNNFQGEMVTIETPNKAYTGTFLRLLENGGLVLQLDTGYPPEWTPNIIIIVGFTTIKPHASAFRSEDSEGDEAC